MPEISVIVPVYNVEKYLHRCIDSILAQTFSDFELILVDDGSSDNSSLICDEYAELDSRVRVFHKNNGGVSSARNTGLNISTGKYIMFCDSDDYVSPNWCKILLDNARNNPDSWCFCGFFLTNEFGAVKNEPRVFASIEHQVIPLNNYIDIYNKGFSALLWICIFESRIIKDNSLHFDENISKSEDVIFCLDYAKYCKQFSITNLPLYYHREYPANFCNHLDTISPKNQFYIDQNVFTRRELFIVDHHLKKFYTDFFYRFLSEIIRIKKDPTLSLYLKFKKIQTVLQSKEYVKASRYADLSKEDAKFIFAIKLRFTPLLFWLIK